VVIAHDTPGDVKASVAVVVTLLIVELLLLLDHSYKKKPPDIDAVDV
jgi:hypothetical protein